MHCTCCFTTSWGFSVTHDIVRMTPLRLLYTQWLCPRILLITDLPVEFNGLSLNFSPMIHSSSHLTGDLMEVQRKENRVIENSVCKVFTIPPPPPPRMINCLKRQWIEFTWTHNDIVDYYSDIFIRSFAPMVFNVRSRSRLFKSTNQRRYCCCGGRFTVSEDRTKVPLTVTATHSPCLEWVLIHVARSYTTKNKRNTQYV